MSRYVGIDLHRRRSVVVIMDEHGTRVSLRRIENSPLALAEAVAEAGPDAEVVLTRPPTHSTPDLDTPSTG